MEQELINIGFTKNRWNDKFLDYKSEHFRVTYYIDGNYFLIKTNTIPDMDEILYPFVSIEKIQNLIMANEQYFSI